MDQKKWKQLVESIINDDEETARSVFHDIVVDKSREIYETMMMEEDDMDDEPGSEVDSLADEIEDEEAGIDDTEMDKPGDEEGDIESEFGSEPGMDDMEKSAEDDEKELEGDMEERLVDTEERVDRIEELMAEFKAQMDRKEGASDLEDVGGEEEAEGMADMEAGAEDEEEGEEEEGMGAEEFEAGAEDEEEGEEEMRAMMEAIKMTRVPVKKTTAVSDMGPVAGPNPIGKQTGAHAVKYTAGGPAKGGSSKARPVGQTFANQPKAGAHMTKVSQKASPGTKGNGSKSPVAKRGK